MFNEIDSKLETWIEARKDEMISSAQDLLRIPSVLGPAAAGAPFGADTRRALEYVLDLTARHGFRNKMLDGYAAWAEFGEGDRMIGVLSHVDVVPVGDAWTRDPFGAAIEGDRIYARGALDDKGPTISGLYAMFAVKECGVPIKQRIRAIVGADEESGFKCMAHYFKTEEMPEIGFTPDGVFPAVYAEKGIASPVVKLPAPTGGNIPIVSIQGGARINMVPSSATIALERQAGGWDSVASKLNARPDVKAEIVDAGRRINVRAAGKGAHASLPHEGVNAIVVLCDALLAADAAAELNPMLTAIRGYAADNTGAILGIAGSDEVSGPLTSNLGTLALEADGTLALGFSVRYPVTWRGTDVKASIEKATASQGAQLAGWADSVALYVPQDDPLVGTLLEVYRAETGDMRPPLSIGGGTYARVLKKGVAFGPSFPGFPEVAHQADEYWTVSDLMRSAKIYAKALARLGMQ